MVRAIRSASKASPTESSSSGASGIWTERVRAPHMIETGTVGSPLIEAQTVAIDPAAARGTRRPSIVSRARISRSSAAPGTCPPSRSSRSEGSSTRVLSDRPRFETMSPTVRAGRTASSKGCVRRHRRQRASPRTGPSLPARRRARRSTRCSVTSPQTGHNRRAEETRIPALGSRRGSTRNGVFGFSIRVGGRKTERLTLRAAGRPGGSVRPRPKGRRNRWAYPFRPEAV